MSITGEPSTNNFSLSEIDAFAHISKHPYLSSTTALKGFIDTPS